MENMRAYLTSYNSSQPLFLGHEFDSGDHRFLSGGSGIVQLLLVANI